MDNHQFDQLIRRLAESPARRKVIAGLVTGSLGLLAADDAEAKKRRKKKPKKNKKKVANTTPPPSTSTTQPPFCAGKPDNTYCGTLPAPPNLADWYMCSGGVCARRPSCLEKSTPNCAEFQGTDTRCCSEWCDLGRCACSTENHPCYFTSDCCGYQEGILECVGYVCQAVGTNRLA